MDIKECRSCRRTKSLTEFYNCRSSADGHETLCKICYNQRNKTYRLLHKSEQIAYRKAYYLQNKEKYAARSKKWRSENKEKRQLWRAANRDKIRAAKKRNKSKPIERIKHHLRKRVAKLLDSKDFSVSASLSCSAKDLRAYIESQFRPGMSWENYGTVWHIDHKIPLSAFDLTDRAQAIAANHYTNLQPLFAAENLLKGDTYSREDLEKFLLDRGIFLKTNIPGREPLGANSTF